jgi:hypothetical protein
MKLNEDVWKIIIKNLINLNNVQDIIHLAKTSKELHKFTFELTTQKTLKTMLKNCVLCGKKTTAVNPINQKQRLCRPCRLNRMSELGYMTKKDALKIISKAQLEIFVDQGKIHVVYVKISHYEFHFHNIQDIHLALKELASIDPKIKALATKEKNQLRGIKASKTRKERKERRKVLIEGLNKLGYNLRDDSKLCTEFIKNGTPPMNQVLSKMTEAHILWEHTNYGIGDFRFRQDILDEFFNPIDKNVIKIENCSSECCQYKYKIVFDSEKWCSSDSEDEYYYNKLY